MSGREWFGHAGHFIGSNKCRFHLHTHVNGLCISTVGDYRPRGFDGTEKPDMIGWQRFYETMVFELLPNGDADYGNELAFSPYSTAEEADAGHLKMVEMVEAGSVGLDDAALAAARMRRAEAVQP